MNGKTDLEKAKDIIDIFAEYLENIEVFEVDDKPNSEKFGDAYEGIITEIMEWL